MKPQTPPAEAPASGLVLESYLPYRLSTASNAVSRLIARAYDDRFGLTVPEWRVMCALAEDGASTQATVAARMVMDKVAVSRAAQGLVRRRLAARQDDGRSHLLELTREGRRLHGEIAPLALAYEAALITGLAPDEVALLKRLLGRLQAAATSLTGDAGLQ